MPKPPSTRPPRSSPDPPAAAAPPTVSSRWLLGAIALTFVLAALCAYGALCLLFYQGQWQLLFHPAHTITVTPASAGLAFDDIRFDVTTTGKPRLDGWWIPAAEPSHSQSSPISSTPSAAQAHSLAAQTPGAATILYLHGSRGSLSNCVPALAALHSLSINVFAIDYQGFGRSAGRHPTERLLDEDAVAAWTYLTDTRHIPARSIVVYGDGIGATLAARVAGRFAPAGVILQDPNPSARQIFLSDARARMVPLFLLQKEFLDPAADLARAHVPRLFLDLHAPAGPSRAHQLFELSSYPKQYYDLRRAPADAGLATLRRFLDEVVQSTM